MQSPREDMHRQARASEQGLGTRGQ
jgi:hypothetical protein